MVVTNMKYAYQQIMRWELGLREKSAAVKRLLLQAAGGAAAAREVQASPPKILQQKSLS